MGEKTFLTLNDTELIKRYRLDQNGILSVWDAIAPSTRRMHAASTETKFMATSCFLLTGKMKLCNSNDVDLSQPTIWGNNKSNFYSCCTSDNTQSHSSHAV